jgi:Arrestin (or S-antigen), C-terminal domain
LPVTGYVSGQSIPITAEADNASNVTISAVKFTLRKLLEFHTHTPRRVTKKDRVVITHFQVGPIEQHSSKTITEKMEIPPLPPSNLTNCGIIDLTYDLLVEAIVSGAHQNLEKSIPIIIGTIPLVDFQPPKPYTDVPVDPSMAPTQPVSPASPPNGQGGAMGWNAAGDTSQLYPNMRECLKV